MKLNASPRVLFCLCVGCLILLFKNPLWMDIAAEESPGGGNKALKQLTFDELNALMIKTTGKDVKEVRIDEEGVTFGGDKKSSKKIKRFKQHPTENEKNELRGKKIKYIQKKRNDFVVSKHGNIVIEMFFDVRINDVDADHGGSTVTELNNAVIHNDLGELIGKLDKGYPFFISPREDWIVATDASMEFERMSGKFYFYNARGDFLNMIDFGGGIDMGVDLIHFSQNGNYAISNNSFGGRVVVFDKNGGLHGDIHIENGESHGCAVSNTGHMVICDAELSDHPFKIYLYNNGTYEYSRSIHHIGTKRRDFYVTPDERKMVGISVLGTGLQDAFSRKVSFEIVNIDDGRVIFYDNDLLRCDGAVLMHLEDNFAIIEAKANDDNKYYLLAF